MPEYNLITAFVDLSAVITALINVLITITFLNNRGYNSTYILIIIIYDNGLTQ